MGDYVRLDLLFDQAKRNINNYFERLEKYQKVG